MPLCVEKNSRGIFCIIIINKKIDMANLKSIAPEWQRKRMRKKNFVCWPLKNGAKRRVEEQHVPLLRLWATAHARRQKSLHTQHSRTIQRRARQGRPDRVASSHTNTAVSVRNALVPQTQPASERSDTVVHGCIGISLRAGPPTKQANAPCIHPTPF